MDLKDHHAQLQQLIAVKHDANFNELMAKILINESTSDKFLIKMELARLSKPSQRTIDLRKRMPEKCQPFTICKIKHYLTPLAIKVLCENVTLYRNYSVGAYEAVCNTINQNARETILVAKEKAEQTDNSLSAERLYFSPQQKRGFERMYFVSDIYIHLQTGEKHFAQTCDISSHGLKIKLNISLDFKINEKVKIEFVGLKSDYANNLLYHDINYQVIKKETYQNKFYLYLSYVDKDAIFIHFLNDFISLKKYKYKMDVHYDHKLVKEKVLKQNYTQHMSILPIYLNSTSSSPFLFSLNNKNNQVVSNKWTCAEKNQLPQLFNEERLAQLILYAQKKTSTTLYSFIHKNYLLSATDEELIELGLRTVFINYGRQKESWAVFHLSINPYHYTSATEKFVILDPDSTKEKYNITHIATLQLITKYCSLPDAKNIESTSLNQLNNFVHRINQSKEQPILNLDTKSKRIERRFAYHKKIQLHFRKKLFNATIINVSISGLKLKLNNNHSLKVEDKVYIYLHQDKESGKNKDLKSLYYKIVKITESNILHLEYYNRNKENIPALLHLLHKDNNKLTEIPDSQQKEIIRLVEKSFICPLFFLRKEISKLKIQFASIDTIAASLSPLFEVSEANSEKVSYAALIQGELYQKLINQPFHSNRSDKEAFIYINQSIDKDSKYTYKSFLEEDFININDKLSIIYPVEKNTRFYAIHYRLLFVDRINLSEIEKQSRTINTLPLHLRRKLEDELLDICAVIEITDLTQQTLLNYIKKE